MRNTLKWIQTVKRNQFKKTYQSFHLTRCIAKAILFLFNSGNRCFQAQFRSFVEVLSVLLWMIAWSDCIAFVRALPLTPRTRSAAFFLQYLYTVKSERTPNARSFLLTDRLTHDIICPCVFSASDSAFLRLWLQLQNSACLFLFCPMQHTFCCSYFLNRVL